MPTTPPSTPHNDKDMQQQLLEKWLVDPSSNVYTARIKPFNHYTAKSIKEICEVMSKTPECKKILCYREGGTKKIGLHYHLRMCFIHSKIKSKTTFLSRMKHYFNKLAGNEMIATKACYVKGKLVQKKELWYAGTYIAKEGDLVYNYGHTHEEVKDLEKVGALLNNSSKLPEYRKIINKYTITEKFVNLEIAKCIYKHYEEIEKKLPQQYHQINMMRNIKIWTNPKYKSMQIIKLASHFDNEEFQYGCENYT